MTLRKYLSATLGCLLLLPGSILAQEEAERDNLRRAEQRDDQRRSDRAADRGGRADEAEARGQAQSRDRDRLSRSELENMSQGQLEQRLEQVRERRRQLNNEWMNTRANLRERRQRIVDLSNAGELDEGSGDRQIAQLERRYATLSSDFGVRQRRLVREESSILDALGRSDEAILRFGEAETEGDSPEQARNRDRDRERPFDRARGRELGERQREGGEMTARERLEQRGLNRGAGQNQNQNRTAMRDLTLDFVNEHIPEAEDVLRRAGERGEVEYWEALEELNDMREDFMAARDRDSETAERMMTVNQLEMESRNIAYRAANADSQEMRQRWEQELRRHLQALFERKLTLEQIELKTLEQEIAETRQLIEQRRGNSEQIIDRRLGDLISEASGDEELKW